ncbi:MAG: AMIN domain-containing protein, partial [Nitrospirales bacterium]
MLACSHTPDPQAVQDVQVRPLERIHVTELEDRLRLELEAGEALSYSLSTNQVPASVTILLPGRSRGAGLSPLEINAGPVLRVVPQEVQKPRLGLELVVSLTHPVKPETQVRGTRLIVDFPRNKSQVESKTVGTADRLGSGMPERAVAPAMEIPPRSFARDGREGKAPQGIKPAKLMTKVEIRRGERDATVVIFGDGTFTYEVLLVDRKRLVVDLAGVASQLRLQTLPVHHSLLRQIRVGEHPNKTRLVFDLAVPVQYVVEAKGDQLTVRLTSSAEAPIPSDAVSQPAPPPALPEPVAAPRPSEAAPEVAQGVVRRTSATTSGTVPFPDRLAILQQEPRLAQMAPETRGPNGPVVVGERKYVGRRISLDFQQADLINVLR